MSAALLLVLAVAVAYLAARVAFDWLARHFLLVSGAEYLLLGILLGPHVSGLFSAGMVQGFAPIITLALGWIGTIVGMQFYLPMLVRIQGEMYRLAFFEALITLSVVAVVEVVATSQLFGMGYLEAAVPALAMGAIGAVSAPAGIEVVARRLGSRGTVVRQLQVTTAIDALVGITTLGLLFCIHHPTGSMTPRPVTATEWAVITIAIGVIGGALFHLFLGNESDPDRIFISLAGAVVLASGAAAYLHLSPLLTSMVVGATLVNTSRNREQIARTLANAERPFYFVLLIFAGATWAPSARAWWVIPVLLFFVARVLAKIGGPAMGARLIGALPVLGPRWGQALLGQGGLALALALGYHQLEGMPLRETVFTATILSILLTDFASAHIVHSVVAPIVGRVRGRGRQEPGGERREAKGEGEGNREKGSENQEAGDGRRELGGGEAGDAAEPAGDAPTVKRR
ncbi:MAG TPA: hypothetical protein VFW98_03395 [Gemmatimonadaceae bacterium]|nr:hypothetical protein [Gemmatimonadaceae bacterium]